MEDCQELLLNHLHVHSSGGKDGVPSASPAPSYSHLHQQQQHQPTHELSLSNVQSHVHHHLHQSDLMRLQERHVFSAQDSHVDNESMQCVGCRTCEDETAVQNTNMDVAMDLSHEQSTGTMDAELMKPHASYSMHAPQAIGALNVVLHHQEGAGVVGNGSISEASTTTPPQPCGTQHMMHNPINLPLSDPFKKRRGRGSRKHMVNIASSLPLPTTPETAHQFRERCQMGALVQGLTPYVITIARGEDVLLRISLFQQERSWGICVLSALGSISNVTLRHSEACSGTVTYEGCYDILALSGSLSPTSDDVFQNRGGLMVSLAGLDGRVFGGEVTGAFVAASPIKVVVGTFLSDTNRSPMQGGDIHNALQAETATAFVAIPSHSPIY